MTKVLLISPLGARNSVKRIKINCKWCLFCRLNPNYQTDETKPMRTVLQIRGDTVYIDQPVMDFTRGLKEIDIFARQFYVKNSTVNFLVRKHFGI